MEGALHKEGKLAAMLYNTVESPNTAGLSIPETPNTKIQISVSNTGIYGTNTANLTSEYREPLDTGNYACLPTDPSIRRFYCSSAVLLVVHVT